VAGRLRKKRKLSVSFGDIGCNTLLYFLGAIDTCTCMGASETNRQGAAIADPSLAARSLSVIGDSTECHSGLDATRNAIFRNIPGVKVILDNRTTAMTGGQPAPTSAVNLAGESNRFDLEAALRGEGAEVRVVDAFDMKAIERELKRALGDAARGGFTVLVLRGECIMDMAPRDKKPRYEIAKDRCKQCDLCLMCPGLEKDDRGYPRFTHLCNGCGGHEGVCVQTCHLGAIVGRNSLQPPAVMALPNEVAAVDEATTQPRPGSLRIAIRGVGGQGNLFMGKVLAEVALRAGYDHVIKGETHGMAQLGGAVLSTFACGDVHSPVLAPGTADAIVALELAETLRPGFAALLKPDGVALVHSMRIVPAGMDPSSYPSRDSVRAALGSARIVEFDALAQARALGDAQGRSTNVIALGLLSSLPPMSGIGPGVWRAALTEVSGRDDVARANLAAFEQGRKAGLAASELHRSPV